MEHTYRIRLVFEKCVKNAIGNWCDTQEIDSRIFFGVSTNKSEVAKSFVRGRNSLNAFEPGGLVSELVGACENVQRELALLLGLAKLEQDSESKVAAVEGRIQQIKDVLAKAKEAL